MVGISLSSFTEVLTEEPLVKLHAQIHLSGLHFRYHGMEDRSHEACLQGIVYGMNVD